MKIAVIGGAGKVSFGAIQDFVENDSVEQLLLADINIEALKKRKEFLNSEKVVISQIDLNDHNALVELLDDYDACLNGTIHYYNLKVMEACLESRTHYTDFGGLFHYARKQLEMHDEFVKAGITGIVGSGSAPGIVNVMAKYAYNRLDTVDAVRIRDGIVNFNANKGAFSPPYAIDTLLDEFVLNPFEFKDGKFVEMYPFSGDEEIDFPEPVGRQTVFNTIHSEVATIPLSFKDKGIKEVTFKLALPKTFEEQLKFLVNLGMGGDKEIDINGVKVAPRKFLATLLRETSQPKKSGKIKHDDHKVLRVEVTGSKDGRETKYIMETTIHPYEKWPHLSQGDFSVGFPAAVTTRLLAEGKIKEKGFYASEKVIDPEIYFSELAKRNINVFANYICHV